MAVIFAYHTNTYTRKVLSITYDHNSKHLYMFPQVPRRELQDPNDFLAQ